MSRSLTRRTMAILLMGLALAASPVPASAQAQAPNDSIAALEALTSQVAAQLRCPVCQGLSIQDSPTDLALEMRAVIRDQLAEGRSPEEVKAYFVSKYGEWVLLQPKPEGFNLAVYILPVAAVLFGGGGLLIAVRRWTGKGGGAEIGEEEGDPLEESTV